MAKATSSTAGVGGPPAKRALWAYINLAGPYNGYTMLGERLPIAYMGSPPRRYRYVGFWLLALAGAYLGLGWAGGVL